LASDFVGSEATPIVILPGEFLAERRSVVSNHDEKSWQPQL